MAGWNAVRAQVLVCANILSYGLSTHPPWGEVHGGRVGIESKVLLYQYWGTSLIRNAHPPRITIGPYA